MPAGKPAGVRCVQLSEDNHCQLFGETTRPQVCLDFRPAVDTCGASQMEALAILGWLERVTGKEA